jgi:hypothetical protein
MIISCNKIEKFSSNVTIINVEDTNSRIGLNDIFSKIEIIPLQMTKESIIGSYKEFKIFNGSYYFRDAQQNCVFVFDRNGKLIFSSKRLQGRGPNEYYNCGHYTIDRETGNILILDMPLRKIIEYNLKGELVKKVSFPNKFVGIMAFEKLSKDIFSFYINENVATANESIIIFDTKQQKVIRKVGPYPNIYLHVLTNSVPFYSINDTIIFNHMFPSYSTYYIDPNDYELIEKRSFDFGHFNFDPDILQKGIDKKNHKALITDYYNKYAIIFNKMENNKFVLVSFFFKHSYIAFLNKSSKKVFIKENISGSREQLLPPDAVDDRYAYVLCSSENLRQVVSDNLIDDSAKKILQNIKITDNRVIVKYKFKNTKDILK